MKKYRTLCFGVLIQTLSSFEAKAMMGSLPLPSSNQFYQTNPTAKMTPQQRTAVGQAFSWAQNEFQRNHAYCKSRETCLSLDLRTLVTFINSRPTHPARNLFKNIYNIIRHDSLHQQFVTQWVIFRNLSQARQQEYRNGMRVTPIQPQNVRTPSGAVAPAFFNQDDVFTDLLEAIEHRHKNCEGYVACLSGDLQIITHLHNRLATNDPVRASLVKLSQIVRNLGNQKIFNTSFYLNLYNPLSPDWNNAIKKHRAKKIAAYGYAEWHQVQKSSRPVSWKTPRITNQAPPNFRSNVEGARSNVQNFKSNLQENKKLRRELWNENKDLLSGWW